MFQQFHIARMPSSLHALWPRLVTPQLILLSFSHTWVIDSGASDHMTGNKSILSFLDSNSFHPLVTLADGFIYHIQGIGAANAILIIFIICALCS